MKREEFKKKVDAIGRSVERMDTALIVFTDGMEHATPCWSITERERFVHYIDVHTPEDSPPICVPYEIIEDVIDYHQKEQ
jgi:hypothetical protein